MRAQLNLEAAKARKECARKLAARILQYMEQKSDLNLSSYLMKPSCTLRKYIPVHEVDKLQRAGMLFMDWYILWLQ